MVFEGKSLYYKIAHLVLFVKYSAPGKSLNGVEE